MMLINKINLKHTLLIMLFCVLEIILMFLIFNFNTLFKPEESLYSIKVHGYNLDNKFSENLYEYNVVVNDNNVEISCDSNIEIEGCNTKLDLTGKEIYRHEIKVSAGNKTNVYVVNIKNESVRNNKEFYINVVNGNTFEWTNKNVTLEVIVSDKNKYLYSFDNGLTWQSSNKKSITENGKYQIVVKNSSGFLSDLKIVEVDKIDKTSPKFTINKTKSSISKVTLEVIATDELSGVDSVSLNGSEFTSKFEYEVDKPGKYYVQVKDKAGNISEKQNIEVNDVEFQKTYVVTLDGNGTKFEKTTLSCIAQTDGCQVTLPDIETNNTMLGWDTNKDSTTPKYTKGKKITIDGNLTLYVITKNTYTATFNKNGATSIGSSSLSCDAYNGGKCSVTTPTITRDGWTIIGWGTKGTSTEAIVGVNKTLELTENKTLYAITRNTYTATFDNTNLNYLEFSTQSCTVYNRRQCRITLPYFNRKGYFNGYWSPNKSASSNLSGTEKDSSDFNTVGSSYVLTENIKLYPNFNSAYYNGSQNYYKYRSLNIAYSKTIGKTIFEFEFGIPQSAINTFINNMTSAYNSMPWLFVPGKAFVMTESTYDKHSIAYGLMHGHASNPLVDLKYDTSGGVVKNAIDINAGLHELGHAFDAHYGFKIGTRICYSSDFKTFYNSIGSKLYVDSNGKISELETFAAMVTNYYWHVLGKDRTKVHYALKSDQTLNSTELQNLKSLIEKFGNIANNGYN